MRVLIVGLGSIGCRHLSNVRRLLPEAEVTVWRHARTPATEQAPAEADRIVHGLEEALSTRPDIAILASPASFHIRTAIELASAGIHMLVEKPLSDTMDGVDRLLDECARRGIVLMVGYHLRFSPSLKCLHGAIADGAIGRVVSLRAEVGQYLPDWRPGTDYRQGVTARRDLGGGVVLELSHELDYVRWLGGEIRSICAETGQLGGFDIDVEDLAEIVLRFNNGAIGSVHLNMLQRRATRTCRVIGSEGTLEWDGLRGYARLSTGDGPWTNLDGPFETSINDMYLAELAHFIRCVTEGGDVPVDGVAGRRVLELALAVKRSAESGMTISVASEDGH